MKPTAILMVGIAMVVGVVLFEVYLPAIILVLSCLTVALILIGTLVPVSSRVYRLEFTPVQAEPATPPAREIPWPCIEGRKLDPHWLRRIECHVEIAGALRLGAIGFVALVTTGLVFAICKNPFRPFVKMDSAEYVVFFALSFAGLVPLSIAAAWFLERRLLAGCAISIGSLNSCTGAYTFCDRNGSRYGGIRKRIAPRLDDNVCVVFYSATHPEVNKSSYGLAFHRLFLHE